MSTRDDIRRIAGLPKLTEEYSDYEGMRGWSDDDVESHFKPKKPYKKVAYVPTAADIERDRIGAEKRDRVAKNLKRAKIKRKGEFFIVPEGKKFGYQGNLKRGMHVVTNEFGDEWESEITGIDKEYGGSDFVTVVRTKNLSNPAYLGPLPSASLMHFRYDPSHKIRMWGSARGSIPEFGYPAYSAKTWIERAL